MLEEVDRFALQCAYISVKPPILLIGMDIGGTGYKKFADGTISIQYLGEIVGPHGHIIINPWWSVVDDEIWVKRLNDIRSVSALLGGTKFHFFCNTNEEANYLLHREFDAILMNHNTFCNDRVFHVGKFDKLYRAIYNAKMTPWKRHDLAKSVKNLALIYSRFGDPDSYLSRVREMLPDAYFLNGDPSDGTYKTFNSQQVAENLNRAKVGLCLSNAEGAMYASIEYLLCGLPIVSTRSKGGRDLFFDDRFCRIVDDDASAVAAAVEELIDRDIDPDFVRAETLKKLDISRDRFVKFIDGLQIANGNEPDGSAAFNRMMSGPWSCWSYKTIKDIRKHFCK
jgi:glycosyltransferase involved in cell wall biosynthesis